MRVKEVGLHLAELQRLAEMDGRETLAYLLSMARLECDAIIASRSDRPPAPPHGSAGIPTIM